MRSYASAIILALPTLAFGASLADFKPYLTDLPSACDIIYRTQIPGCKASDFQSGRGCSDSCVTGLTATAQVVKAACGSATLPGNDVITAILGGNGVNQLCPNAPSVAVTTSSTSAPSPTTTSTTSTSTTPTSTSTPSSTSTTSTSQTTTAANAATTSSSSATSSTSGNSSSAQTTSASSASTAAGSSTATSATTGTAPAQSATRTGGNNSGGGSPFDSNSSGAASGTAIQVQHVFSAALIAAFALLR